jgi:hypothetical protein
MVDGQEEAVLHLWEVVPAERSSGEAAEGMLQGVQR